MVGAWHSSSMSHGAIKCVEVKKTNQSKQTKSGLHLFDYG